MNDTSEGGARGGLTGYNPLSEHANPPSEGEKLFFLEIFGIYSILETIF